MTLTVTGIETIELTDPQGICQRPARSRPVQPAPPAPAPPAPPAPRPPTIRPWRVGDPQPQPEAIWRHIDTTRARQTTNFGTCDFGPFPHTTGDKWSKGLWAGWLTG